MKINYGTSIEKQLNIIAWNDVKQKNNKGKITVSVNTQLVDKTLHTDQVSK